jgi:acyl dehydratase
MNINAGFDKIRFIQPVKVNSQIRALAKVANIEEVKYGQYLLQMDITVEIEIEDKPALIEKWNCMQMVK